MCEHRGPRPEKLDWLGRYQRVTERFAAREKLLQAASVQAVAALRPGLAYGQIDRQDALASTGAEPDWSTIRYLAMDEFALHKGHRYATVVVDPIGRQVPAAPAFANTPEGVAERIEAVAIDMTTAYELEIRSSVRKRKSSLICTTSWPSMAAK